MRIQIFNKQRDLKLNSKATKQIIQHILSTESIKCDEISVHFVTEKKISELHDQFFQDPSPTDCITFPMDPIIDSTCNILGEIFVCPKIALQYAKDNNLNPYEETTLYIVHGILHLLGYDDTNPTAKKMMRNAEKKHMKLLNNNNLRLD